MIKRSQAGGPKTIVITGASSGIGKVTARRFAREGWNVVAAMRHPEAESDLIEGDGMKFVPIDVQHPASIRAAVESAMAAFGAIDVWVNNAGYGTFGPVEAGSREAIERQFNVNVFGLIECFQAIAPHFRAKRAGVLINVSSAGGLMTSPGFGVYNASKFAVEGLSEGLWYEMRGLGIRVKLIEPGVVRTDFGGRSMDIWDASALPDYASVMARVNAMRARVSKTASPPETVAAMIFQAANDPSDRLRYIVGADARTAWRLRRWLGPRAQMWAFRKAFKL